MLNSVIEYLKYSYKFYPDKNVIVDNYVGTSYREFFFRVCQIAGWINKNLNVVRKPIIVLMNNSTEALETFFGIALSNNIYVPLDSNIPLHRLESIVSIIKPAGIIICKENNQNLNIAGIPIIQFYELLSTKIETDIIKSCNAIVDTDPLYILFTSGSTGVPKGVVVSHKSVIDFTEEASETMDFSEKEIFLNQAPFYFDASVPDIFCTIRNGATLHIIDKSLYAFPIKLVDYIEKNRINAIFWVPSALILVANLKALGKRNLSSLKKIMFCGEVMPTKQLNMWRQAVPNAIYVNYYGPSEATYACSYYVVDREFKDEEVLPIGHAALNTDILLINEKGEQVIAPNEKGEIYIRGTGLALGYYNNPEKTRECFIQNPLQSSFPEILYKTGDLAHYDSDRNIIYDGRVDYQIKHLGYRIELGEIESNVISMKDVKQCACVYNEQKDIIVCFYSGDVEKKIIKELLKEKLPFYMIPKIVIQMKELPINSNGKIDRILLFQKT